MTPVKQLMNLKYRYVRNDTDETEVLLMMRSELLRQVPVLDKMEKCKK